MRRFTWISLLLAGCATPGAKYFAGEAESCLDVDQARPYALQHESELTAEQRAELAVDSAHCQAEANKGDIEPLLTEAIKLDPDAVGDADAERAALLAQQDGKSDEAVALFKQALSEHFADLDLVLTGGEFEKLVRIPALERPLLELAAQEEPVAPRVEALAEKLGQRPIPVVVAQANPKYGLNTFTVWRGRVLESHYDEDNDETAILLEEMLEHEHEGEGEEHQHYETVWTPDSGFTKMAHEHNHEHAEEHVEWEATGRLFGLRVRGFPRELVEAPDLEVVGYYLGMTPFVLKGTKGDAPTLEVLRAVPFNSGVHLGTEVAHSHE
jgi:hypothetical protein